MYLRTILPKDLLPFSHLDVSTRESLSVIGTGSDTYLALRLYHGQPKSHGGERAEVSLDFPFVEGDEIHYEWRFKVDDDFVSDFPSNRWWIIGQWHDQPDQRTGDTWDSFPSNSPPISIGIGELDGHLAIVMTYGVTRTGHTQTSTPPIPIERGVWYQVRANIRWSQSENGTADVFLNESPEPSFVAKGANMNNGYQHYLKLGMYRHPSIDTENTIFIDDVSAKAIDGK